MMEWTLEHVHILAGTPWWLSISLTALLVRAILFKAYIDAADNGAKLATIKYITDPITTRMRNAQKERDTDGVMKAKLELSTIHKRAGIKVWKSFVPLVQIFAGYGTFVLLRGMASLPVPGLEDGGILWFYDLTARDPFFLLPLLTSFVLHKLLKVSLLTLTILDESEKAKLTIISARWRNGSVNHDPSNAQVYAMGSPWY